MSADSPELEALFDSILDAEDVKAAPKPQATNDTPELETLFDSITLAMIQDNAGSGDPGAGSEKVFAQVGQMTRSLHNLLRELGFDKAISNFSQDLPDTRDRLNYIAAMTAQAAEKTLNAAEAAKPLQENMANTAQALASKWDQMLAKQLGVQDFKALVGDTHRYLHAVPQQSELINAKLMEIIMAQDFQDLTGQVIRKVLDAAQNLESQLVTLLLETTPEDKRNAVRPGLLEGPVINATGRSDVVTSQEQVDELLESLGF
jgi:chemotaxis protein CheZ